MGDLSDAQRAEMKRLTSRSRRRAAQAEQDLLAGLWRFPVLHKTDFDRDGDGTWLYHELEPAHGETTTVVLLQGRQARVFKCVADEVTGLLRWMSIEVCEPDAGDQP